MKMFSVLRKSNVAFPEREYSLCWLLSNNDKVREGVMEHMEVDAPEGEQQKIELSEKLKEEANKLFVGTIFSPFHCEVSLSSSNF